MKNPALLSLTAFVLSVIVLAGGLSYAILKLPTEKQIKSCMTTSMYKIKLCPGSDSYVPLNRISPYLIQSVITSEDGSFYTHGGFDYDEIKKSLEENVEKGGFARGGSTISQQLAKNLFLTKEKSLTRKFREALITMRIEGVLSKNQILERYLNVVEFGDRTFGVKAAAQKYFHKTPAELNIAESAFLTFLLPSPKKYASSFLQGSLSPFSEKRMKDIVDRLYQFKKISDEEYARALQELAQFPGANSLKIDLSLDADSGPIHGDDAEEEENEDVEENPPVKSAEEQTSDSLDSVSEGE